MVFRVATLTALALVAAYSGGGAAVPRAGASFRNLGDRPLDKGAQLLARRAAASVASSQWRMASRNTASARQHSLRDLSPWPAHWKTPHRDALSGRGGTGSADRAVDRATDALDHHALFPSR